VQHRSARRSERLIRGDCRPTGTRAVPGGPSQAEPGHRRARGAAERRLAIKLTTGVVSTWLICMPLPVSPGGRSRPDLLDM